VVNEIWLLRLRALLARDRYRALATSLGFEGHMKWAEAMPCRELGRPVTNYAF
jgi:adenylate cyclase